MEVIKYSEKYYDDYDNYTKKNKNVLFFYSIKYLNFLVSLLNANNETLMVIDNNEVVGILPLFSKSGEYGYVYNSLPYYGSNGFIIADSEEAFNILLNSYNKLLELKDTFSSTVITNPLIQYKNLEKQLVHNFSDYRIGQVTSFNKVLSKDLMSIFHYKTRNMIRKAFKSNVVVGIDNSKLDFLERVHKENMKIIGGNHKDANFFNSLNKYFHPGDDFNLYVATLHNQPIAALLVFYFNDTVEYYTPVIKVEFRNIQPLSAIIFTAMQDAVKNGYQNWNWGGTWQSQDSVYRFKKRWGARDITYKYFTKLNVDVDKISKSILLENYAGFYTVPFEELEKG